MKLNPVSRCLWGPALAFYGLQRGKSLTLVHPHSLPSCQVTLRLFQQLGGARLSLLSSPGCPLVPCPQIVLYRLKCQVTWNSLHESQKFDLNLKREKETKTKPGLTLNPLFHNILQIYSTLLCNTQKKNCCSVQQLL